MCLFKAPLMAPIQSGYLLLMTQHTHDEKPNPTPLFSRSCPHPFNLHSSCLLSLTLAEGRSYNKRGWRASIVRALSFWGVAERQIPTSGIPCRECQPWAHGYGEATRTLALSSKAPRCHHLIFCSAQSCPCAPEMPAAGPEDLIVGSPRKVLSD